MMDFYSKKFVWIRFHGQDSCDMFEFIGCSTYHIPLAMYIDEYKHYHYIQSSDRRSVPSGSGARRSRKPLGESKLETGFSPVGLHCSGMQRREEGMWNGDHFTETARDVMIRFAIGLLKHPSRVKSFLEKSSCTILVDESPFVFSLKYYPIGHAEAPGRHNPFVWSQNEAADFGKDSGDKIIRHMWVLGFEPFLRPGHRCFLGLQLIKSPCRLTGDLRSPSENVDRLKQSPKYVVVQIWLRKSNARTRSSSSNSSRLSQLSASCVYTSLGRQFHSCRIKHTWVKVGHIMPGFLPGAAMEVGRARRRTLPGCMRIIEVEVGSLPRCTLR